MSWLPECRVVPVFCSEKIPIGECYEFQSLADLQQFGIVRASLDATDFPCVFVHPDGDTSKDIRRPKKWEAP